MQLPLPASFPEQRKQLPHRAYLRRDRTCTCAYVQECGHSPQKGFPGPGGHGNHFKQRSHRPNHVFLLLPDFLLRCLKRSGHGPPD